MSRGLGDVYKRQLTLHPPALQVFLYLVGMQLLLSGGTSSLLAGCSGLAAGLLWRANVAGLKRFRVSGVEAHARGEMCGAYGSTVAYLAAARVHGVLKKGTGAGGVEAR